MQLVNLHSISDPSDFDFNFFKKAGTEFQSKSDIWLSVFDKNDSHSNEATNDSISKFDAKAFEEAYLGGFRFGSNGGKMYDLESLDYDHENAVQANSAFINVGGDMELLTEIRDQPYKPTFVQKSSHQTSDSEMGIETPPHRSKKQKRHPASNLISFDTNL